MPPVTAPAVQHAIFHITIPPPIRGMILPLKTSDLIRKVIGWRHYLETMSVFDVTTAAAAWRSLIRDFMTEIMVWCRPEIACRVPE